MCWFVPDSPSTLKYGNETYIFWTAPPLLQKRACLILVRYASGSMYAADGCRRLGSLVNPQRALCDRTMFVGSFFVECVYAVVREQLPLGQCELLVWEGAGSPKRALPTAIWRSPLYNTLTIVVQCTLLKQKVPRPDLLSGTR